MTDDSNVRYSSWQPTPLGETLERFLTQLGAPPVQTVGSLHACWPDVVGPVLAEHSRPVEVIDDVLTVFCDDSSWASQLTWMDHQIKQRCAEVFDGLEIRRVQVRVRA